MQMKANKIKTLFILWLDCKVKGMGRRGEGGLHFTQGEEGTTERVNKLFST